MDPFEYFVKGSLIMYTTFSFVYHVESHYVQYLSDTRYIETSNGFDQINSDSVNRVCFM